MVAMRNTFRPRLEGLEDRLTPAVASPILVAAPDAGSVAVLRVYDAHTLTQKSSFLAYPVTYTGGVTVATGDYNRDGVADVITGTLHGEAVVKVFSGADGTLLRSLFPYGSSFRSGVYVAGGDVNGDGFDDIITGTAEGGGSLVKVFSGRDLTLLRSFLAYDPSFTNGVRVGAGDVNGDGRADIIVGPGVNGGSLIKVFDGGTARQLWSWQAFAEAEVTNVFVRIANVTGDGQADLIISAGSGFPWVKVVRALDHQLIYHVVPFEPTYSGGVRTATADLNGDGLAEIVMTPGPGRAPEARIFDPATKTMSGFISYEPDFTGGIFIGAGVSQAVPHLHGKNATPLKLSGAGQLNLSPATLSGAFTASGESTFLGHWTNEGMIQLVQTDATTYGASGTVTFTAANGDKLYATFVGAIDLTTGKAAGTFTFNGGTGRFAHASGTAEAVIVQDFATGAFTFTLDGELSFDASDRKR